VKSTSCTAALALLFLFACGGGNKSNPTAPQSQIVVSVFLDSFTANGGVLQATVSIDGQELGHSDWTTLPQGCLSTCQVLGSEDGTLASGMHTVTVKVVRQTLDTVSYDVRGTVFLNTPTANGTIPLPLQSASLKAQGTVDYDISV